MNFLITTNFIIY